MRALPFAVAALAATLTLPPAWAAPPPGGDRFQIQPAEGGFLRLDRETGATSFCAASGDGYACKPVSEAGTPPDASEIARLEARVAALEAQVRQSPSGLPPAPPLPPGDGPQAKDPKLDLPSDEQFDRVTSFIERALRRLKRFADEMQKEDPPQGERL
ncbi:hypothetical protein [Hansschlegelia plantiphila]|uniref:Uncharacterized protein n=1 Tax=Hansschlegelia plantiphila TaxID=374655 RepID=A0A9W6MVY0_9HYPH|nr:hypothetical protein [Hansschlegelia plantiphila]GLK68488.1 hypothetical protein GCM10008179_21260 [Hansschlegelia plantiphila]